jgi:transcriptional regulator with XRE-family HTH domain
MVFCQDRRSVEQSVIGRQLRARRTAAGRTVASVAADAGLSVPYIANLENGRGNPTITVLTRLAEALDMKLDITLVSGEEDRQAHASASPEIPASLVRLGRTVRFRRAVTTIAAALEVSADEFSAQLVAALATLARAMGRELTEPDWWRLLDALLLIAAHPAASLEPRGKPAFAGYPDKVGLWPKRHLAVPNQSGGASPGSTRASRTRRGCMTTILAARTTSRPTG